MPHDMEAYIQDLRKRKEISAGTLQGPRRNTARAV
jgi:hypothetical protein